MMRDMKNGVARSIPPIPEIGPEGDRRMKVVKSKSPSPVETVGESYFEQLGAHAAERSAERRAALEKIEKGPKPGMLTVFFEEEHRIAEEQHLLSEQISLQDWKLGNPDDYLIGYADADESKRERMRSLFEKNVRERKAQLAERYGILNTRLAILRDAYEVLSHGEKLDQPMVLAGILEDIEAEAAQEVQQHGEPRDEQFVLSRQRLNGIAHVRHALEHKTIMKQKPLG